MRYEVVSTKGTDGKPKFYRTKKAAILAAKQVNRYLRPAFGVTVTDRRTGLTVFSTDN